MLYSHHNSQRKEKKLHRHYTYTNNNDNELNNIKFFASLCYIHMFRLMKYARLANLIKKLNNLRGQQITKTERATNKELDDERKRKEEGMVNLKQKQSKQRRISSTDGCFFALI